MWHCSQHVFSLLILLKCARAESQVTGAQVFVKGAALVGGSNGMFFDADNNLYVAQALGRTVSKLDPETGNVLEALSVEEGIFFPDDLTVGPNGDLFWTDVLGGTIGTRPSGGEPEILYPYGTYPNANPITLSDDGNRLFFAQCFNIGEPNGIYQRDLTTNETTTILEGVPLCASNAMDFRNESLYSPRIFEGRVIRIDLENDNQVTNVTTNIGIPVAVKFDMQGRLHALDTSNGQVLRIDLDNPDTANNTELVAQLPIDALDNLAFDKDNRLYVSTFSRGTVWEVLDTTDFRTVSPGIFSATSGIAVLNDNLYTVHPLGIHGFDINTAEENTLVWALPGGSDLLMPTAVVSAEQNLIILSFLFNAVMLYDVDTNEVLVSASFEAPTDAHPFQGGVLVAEAATGNIVNASGTDLSSQTVIATLPGTFFLAGNETDVFATNTANGTTLQIISDGVVLDPPTIVSSGHSAPEGLALYDNDLLVVSTGSGTLEKVNIATGDVETLAEGFEFLPPLADFGLAFGYTNDVAVHEGDAFVNADASNVIYKVNLDSSMVPMSNANAFCGSNMMNLTLIVGIALALLFSSLV